MLKVSNINIKKFSVKINLAFLNAFADKMVDNVYVKCTYVWNKSTKVWDRD